MKLPKFLKRKKKKPFKAGTKVSGLSIQSSTKTKSKRKFRSLLFSNRLTKQILSLFLVLIGLVTTGYIIYQSAQIVLRIREKSTEGFIKGDEHYIVGFNDVPIYFDKNYGEAEFVFKNKLYEESVQKFLNEGYSVYRIPVSASINEVYDFYSQVLPTLGWTYVLEIEPGTDGMKEGQYWVKDGVGLRIYSRINDIWYQRLSENDARTGLAEKVTIEQERETILAESEGYDLLPSFPWTLKVPENITASYAKIAVVGAKSIEELTERDFQYAHFKAIDSDEEVVLIPYKIYDGTSLYNYALSFSEDANLHVGHAYEVVTEVGSGMEVNVRYLGAEEGVEESSDKNEGEDADGHVGGESNSNSNSSSDDPGEENREFEIEKQQLPDLNFDKILVLLHDDLKVVYVLAHVESDDGSSDFYQYIKNNISSSVAPKYDD